MVIVEIGLNHMGSMDLVNEYISVLSDTEIDAITLQIREDEYYQNPEKSKYLLSKDDYLSISNMIHNCGKKFGVAIADINCVDYLEEIGVDFYKIIRNDITNTELTDKLMSTGKKIIVSTGLSSDEEIETFMSRYEGKYANDTIVLNHTQLSYDHKDCNLSAISAMQTKYKCNVSYGSHCENSLTLYMSLCYNPSDVLFYVKGRDPQKYPDDKHAINLDAVKFVSSNLKNLSKATGTGIKEKMVNKIESKIETPYEKSERLKNEDADQWDNTLWG